MAENKTKSTLHPAFTVDADGTNANTIPSVTRLLNRKSLKNSVSSRPAPQPPAAPLNLSPAQKADATPPAHQEIKIKDTETNATDVTQVVSAKDGLEHIKPEPQEGIEISMNAEEVGPTVLVSTQNMLLEKAAVQPETPIEQPAIAKPKIAAHPVAKRVERKAAGKKLIQWELKNLRSGVDPLGKGIAAMIDKGVLSALFLSIGPIPPGSSTPEFFSSAAVFPQKRVAIWTGMKWDPKISPETWNLLLKNGYVEFPPPGTMTNLQSIRNVARAAFGAIQEEWLSMVRIGPATGCRGLLIMIATKTLAAEITHTLPVFQAPAPKQPRT